MRRSSIAAAALRIPISRARSPTTASAPSTGLQVRVLGLSRGRCRRINPARRCWRRRGGSPPGSIGRDAAAMCWMRQLEHDLEKRGSVLMRGTDVVELIVENGACAGVVARQGGRSVRIAGGAAVVADGGFAANPEMVAQWITPRSDHVLARVAPGAHGDGIRMAEAAGAAIGGFG